jgi:hypothetical protein
VQNADYQGLMRWGFVTNADYPGLMRWGFVTNADYPGLMIIMKLSLAFPLLWLSVVINCLLIFEERLTQVASGGKYQKNVKA